jgi:alpha-galactosidase
MLLSFHPSGALLLDHWGAGTVAERGDDYLPRPPRNRPSHAAFLDGVPQAFPVYGDPSFKEPCLSAVYADGTRIVRLTVRNDQIEGKAETSGLRVSREAGEGAGGWGPQLTLTFEDPVYHLVVSHRFEVFPDHDVIRRTTLLENAGDAPVLVERALSGGIGLPPGQYDAWTLHGQWGGEYQLQARRLGPGKFTTESRRGFTS